MQSAVRIGGVGAVSLAFLAAGASAAAAPKRITGKLNKPGYTVIALAANGKATSAKAKKRGKFGVVPPTQRVTLHLRAKDGTYAGPIVARGKGKRVVVGLKAGARLGKIKIGTGFARVKKKLPKKSVDASRRARAKKGVPIGAGVFGRVASPPSTKVPGDGDLDGLPDALDIDDDGDLILDNLDRSPRAARASQTPNEFFGLQSGLDLPIHDTANANAPGSTDQQIEAALPTFGTVILEILPGDSAELDCGGLVYCSTGGTGRVPQNLNPPTGPPFPHCCDPDGDGFGTLTPSPGLPPPATGMFLLHGATTAQIGTGDVLIQRVSTGGVENQFPATLQFAFATVPALVSYRDTAGNSGTVSYPVAGPYTGPPSGYRPPGPGVKGNGFPVAAGPDGNVVLTLTYWRPQRRPIPGEPGDGVPGAWTDIGGLAYTAGIPDIGIGCPQSSVSETDPNLTTAPPPVGGGGGFTDLAPDLPASAANTFTYTLNVTQCLTSQGISWNPGEEHDLRLGGTDDSADQTGQAVAFKRQ
jgi:hypothetical protein